MKNKILASLTVLCAALVLVGGFSVTAYAQTPTEETDDSGVIVETEPQPLTPEGNMTLVDDIDGDAAEDKQFIVVKSKGGNYFYIIVDRAAEGENSVHFLNQVDESDLMAIIGEEQTEQPPAVCNCTEKCKAGEVNTACPVCSVNMSECMGKEAPTPEPEVTPEPTAPEKKGGSGLLIFVVLAVLAAVLCVGMAALGGWALVLAALAVLWRYYAVSRKQFGGITGDLAGWFLQKAELWMLAALCVCQWGGLL